MVFKWTNIHVRTHLSPSPTDWRPPNWFPLQCGYTFSPSPPWLSFCLPLHFQPSIKHTRNKWRQARVSVIFSPALLHKRNKTDRRKVYSKVMASANMSRAWMNRKVPKKNKTAALTSAWKGSGSSMLGPMTALLSSLSFLSRRPAAMTAACCSATLAASSSWKKSMREKQIMRQQQT